MAWGYLEAAWNDPFLTGQKNTSQAIEKSDAAAAEFADLHLEDFRIRFPDGRIPASQVYLPIHEGLLEFYGTSMYIGK